MPNRSVEIFDPLRDPRWPEFLGRHPSASVFHSRGWLRALQRTYHYEPLAFTTSKRGEALNNAVVFCAVRSWLTGNRLVSLPFSDHCDPLVESAEQLSEILLFASHYNKQKGWKYVEVRPSAGEQAPAERYFAGDAFCLHRVDLRPSLESLLRSFHKDCVQRKIRKAEREKLEYEAGRSEQLVRKFFALLVETRRRHCLPPQPFEWFRNLMDCPGESVCIRIASKDGQPVAGILTLTHGKKLVYKYGGSIAQRNNLGGMAMLFWKTIQEAKREGCEEMDLGRSDCHNQGLIAFKEHWGGRRTRMTYWSSQTPGKEARLDNWKTQAAQKVFARLPQPLLVQLGRVFYKHIG